MEPHDTFVTPFPVQSGSSSPASDATAVDTPRDAWVSDRPMSASGSGRANARAWAKVFSFPVLLGGLLVGAVFVSGRLGIEDPDTWWHIAAGERILTSRAWATHAWPASDTFSFTVSGSAWLPYEWLGEVAMALAVRAGGLRGLTAGVIVVASLLFLLLYYYAYLRSANPKAAFAACAMLLPLAVVFFTSRPQLIGYLFLLVTLVCLERFRQGRQKSLWMLPPLFALWVNTHGSFTFGLMALGLYWISGLARFRQGGLESAPWTAKQRRHLALVFLVCLVALTLTPYGTRLAANPIDIAFAQPVNIANINEWQSMPFGFWHGKFFLILILSFILAQIVFRLSYRLEEMALFLGGVYAACLHVRFLLVFVIVFAPLAASLLARWTPAYDRASDKPVLNAVLLGLVGAGIVAFFPGLREIQQLEAKKFPRKAVEYLRDHPAPQPMLNDYGWGGYLIWSFGGQHKVFIDGRTDIYEYAGVFPDALRIAHLDPEALPLLRKYNIQSCLIQQDAPLGTLLSALPDWQRVYKDDVSALYVHSRAQKAPSGPGGAGR